MTMRSTNMLPALRELPTGESSQRVSFRAAIESLVNTDRVMFGAEFASAVSFGMWGIFRSINVDDNLTAAYEAQYPGLAADRPLHEQWQEMMNSGEQSMDKFVAGLKGKVAEFEAKEMMQAEGYTNVVMASDPTNEGWDISAVSPDGQEDLSQVKTGVSDSQYYDTLEAMRESDYTFWLGSELHERISDNHPELSGQIGGDIGSDYEMVEGITDDLQTLSSNMGIDVPDHTVVNLLPYAGAIAASARLIYNVVKTERKFKAIDRTERNKVQVVQTLTLMSRMGVNTLLTTAGGSGGAAAGTVVTPGPGTVVGAILGMIGGWRVGMYLNNHLTGPRMMDLALDITGLTRDDLFYYKNKKKIDRLALSFHTRSKAVQGAL